MRVKDFKSYFINESHQEAQESIKDIFLDLTAKNLISLDFLYH